MTNDQLQLCVGRLETARLAVTGETDLEHIAMIEDGQPDVRLGTAVAEVNQDGERVQVVTESGQKFEARAVVAALPMNVLADIRFNPGLDPARLAASRERHAANRRFLELLLAHGVVLHLVVAPTVNSGLKRGARVGAGAAARCPNSRMR